MPKSLYKGRGKVLRYRTLHLGEGKYLHLAVVSKAGKRGGHTISGKVYTEKHKPKHHKVHHSHHSSLNPHYSNGLFGNLKKMGNSI